jgi:hypothetical protein
MIAPTASTTSYSYKFDDLSMITNLSPAFKIDNIKNDFTIWGTKNKSLPFHIRYAIDKKPFYYRTLPYEETRNMTYLKLSKYTSGKCFIKEGLNKFVENYNVEYTGNSKTEATRYYYWENKTINNFSDINNITLVAKKVSSSVIQTKTNASETQLSNGKY